MGLDYNDIFSHAALTSYTFFKFLHVSRPKLFYDRGPLTRREKKSIISFLPHSIGSIWLYYCPNLYVRRGTALNLLSSTAAPLSASANKSFRLTLQEEFFRFKFRLQRLPSSMAGLRTNLTTNDVNLFKLYRPYLTLKFVFQGFDPSVSRIQSPLYKSRWLSSAPLYYTNDLPQLELLSGVDLRSYGSLLAATTPPNLSTSSGYTSLDFGVTVLPLLRRKEFSSNPNRVLVSNYLPTASVMTPYSSPAPGYGLVYPTSRTKNASIDAGFYCGKLPLKYNYSYFRSVSPSFTISAAIPYTATLSETSEFKFSLTNSPSLGHGTSPGRKVTKDFKNLLVGCLPDPAVLFFTDTALNYLPQPISDSTPLTSVVYKKIFSQQFTGLPSISSPKRYQRYFTPMFFPTFTLIHLGLFFTFSKRQLSNLTLKTKYFFKKVFFSFLRPNEARAHLLFTFKKFHIFKFTSLQNCNFFKYDSSEHRAHNHTLFNFFKFSFNLTSLFSRSIQPAPSLLENPILLANPLSQAADIKIPRIKFKPGYQKLWRRYREALKESLGVKFIYQKQLTRYLVKFFRKTTTYTFSQDELKLSRILISSKLLPDLYSTRLFLGYNLIFINGYPAHTGDELTLVGDFIQLELSTTYYIFFR